jgi:DNA-binding CsgD family transcriptional regulator
MDNVTTGANRDAGRSGIASLRSPPLLVGRSREQDDLRVELAAARGGHGRLVLLGGEAGIGKTSLARDLIAAADDLGCRVVAGSCYDLANTPPYGPWLDLFEGCRRDPGLPAPPAPFVGGRLAPVTDQAALFAEVRQFLAELAAARPALVLLEDLHWADPASVDLLRHIGPHLRHWPLLLLATYRVDELTPGHPFAHQMPALVREAEGQRLDLRRLDEGAVRALVAARYRLERAAEDRLVAYLERHAEGNPFFATELLRTLEEEALLRRDEDGWTLAALDRVVVPSLLRQVIDGRVARLGEATRKALALAAVIGQEVPLALWAEVAALDEETVLAVVERAVEAHLVEADRDGTRVRFVHALTREALYEGVLPPRRRVWHRRVAEALMAKPGPDPDAVAYHLREAGDPRAWEWLVKAGDRAQRAYAWLTAAERLRAAADLLTGVDGTAGTRGRLLYRLARLYRFSDPTEAAAILDEVERLAARRGDAILAAEVLWQRGGVLCYGGQFRSGLAEMERGIEALEAMPLEEAPSVATVGDWLADALPETAPIDTTGEETAAALLHAAGLHFRRSTHPLFLAYAGQLREACAIGDRYVAVLAEAPRAKGGIHASTSFTYHGLGLAYAALGRPDDAHRAWTRARGLLREFDHHIVVAFTLLDELRNIAFTYEAADPVARRRLAAEAEAALGRAGGALRPGVSSRLAWLGCLVLEGRWEAALQILDDLPAPGNAYLQREVTDTRAILARHRGEPETAWAQIRPLLPEGPASEPGDIIHQEGLSLQRLAADLCLDAGNPSAARAWLEAHDRWLAWSGSMLGRADGRVSWARYYWATGDTECARAAAIEALALAASPSQPLVCLAAHRFMGEIETAAKRFGAAEVHLVAALDLAAACEAPFERALTLFALSELRHITGMADEAATLLDEVRRICTPLGAAPTLARADALAAHLATTRPDKMSFAGLTERELDVLRLLPEDLTLEQIAARLFISYSTVKTHLDHIRDKFGVSRRRDVVARAAQLGLLAPPRHPPSPPRVGDG